MKLNKLERYTLYVILLRELILGRGRYTGEMEGLCQVCNDVLGDDEVVYYLLEYRYKATLTGGWWFRNNDERIAALKACILETHPENK